MKTTRASLAFFAAACLAATTCLGATGVPVLDGVLQGVLGTPTGLRFESEPSGAKVDYRLMKQRKDGTQEEDDSVKGNLTTPDSLKKFSMGKSEQLVVEFSLADYFPVTTNYDYAWFANKPARGESYLCKVALKKSKEVIPVLLQAEGATFKVDGREASAETTLVFTRTVPAGSCNTVEIQATRADHEIAPQRLTFEAVSKLPQQNGRRTVAFTSQALQESRLLTIECNEVDTLVTLGTRGSRMTNGSKRLSLELVFQRDNAAAKWSQVSIRVEKPSFEWCPRDIKEPQPAFERTFSPEDIDALGGRLVLDAFKPVRFIATGHRYYRVDNQGAILSMNDAEFAEVSTDEPSMGRNPLPYVQPKKQEMSIILSRLSVPQGAKRVYFAMANFDYREGRLQPAGSTICYSEGLEGMDPIQLTTQPENQDTDPCVAFDGSEVYFSSLHNDVRCIKKISVNGGIPYPITENTRYMDTEPAVSKAGRLVFTRRVIGAPSTKPPAIYLQEKEQNVLVQRYGELTPGTSASWSPNGDWVAFVGVDGGLYIVRPDGTDRMRRPISTGGLHAYPTWDPLGSNLFFSAAKNKNQRDRFQYDIWRVEVSRDGIPGKAEPLTANGSMDSSPACWSDADKNLVVFFLSNRGMPRPGNPTLEIYRLAPSAEAGNKQP